MDNSSQGSADRTNRKIRPFLTAVVGFNMLLIAVSFTAWFSGTEKTLGFADRAFGKLRFGGFRADFAWLLLTSAVLFLALLFFIVESRKSRVARVNAVLCLAEVLALVAYLYYSLVSGLLDMG
jgi:hypothetical protein